MLTGTEFVASRTNALEIALLVNTLCVPAAGIRYLLTLVLVNALMRVLVVNKTAVTLTFETAGRVHATAVGAHGRHQSALIDLFGVIRDRIHDLTRHQSAENLVFTCSLARAFLTEATPCGTHGTAA